MGHHYHRQGGHGYHHAARQIGRHGQRASAGTVAAGMISDIVAASVVARPISPARLPPLGGLKVAGPPATPPTKVVPPRVPLLALSSLQPLCVSSVRIVADATERREGITFFGIEVFPEDGRAPWRVWRRYNQFNDLASKLGAYHLSEAPFPRKHLTGCEGAKLERRRDGLESWLSRVLKGALKNSTWIAELRSFLEVDVHSAHSTPRDTAYSTPRDNLTSAKEPSSPTSGSTVASWSEQLRVAASSPVTTPPSSPSPADVNPSCEGVLLEIEVPVDVAAGQFLSVTMPNGTQMLLMMPDGAFDGQTLQVWHDKSSGSLKLMPSK